MSEAFPQQAACKMTKIGEYGTSVSGSFRFCDTEQLKSVADGLKKQASGVTDSE
jgi:hypothetical protein